MAMEDTDEFKEFVRAMEELNDDDAEVEKEVLVNYDLGAPGDALADHGGSGEVRDVIRILNDAGIAACVIGTHALRYYGAGRLGVVSISPVCLQLPGEEPRPLTI